MKPIRSIKGHLLMTCLIASFISGAAYLTPVHAVTDAELEALEKQLEQQELNQREAERQTAEDSRRKAEAKKIKEQQVQLEKERRKLEKEKKRIEETRKAELERKREEKVANKKAEQEKTDEYNSLISEAEQAINKKDKELAISKYTEALVIVPADTVVITGLKKAEKLMNKFCYELIGTWKEPSGDITKFYENGIVKFIFAFGEYEHPWECFPEKRQVKMNYLNNNNPVYITSFKLSNDNKRIYFADRNSLYVEKISDDYVD
jgi:flagellar biosynthesis GTPase FlhF